MLNVKVPLAFTCIIKNNSIGVALDDPQDLFWIYEQEYPRAHFKQFCDKTFPCKNLYHAQTSATSHFVHLQNSTHTIPRSRSRPMTLVFYGNVRNSTHCTETETEAGAIGFCTQFYRSRPGQCKHTIASICGSFLP